MGACFSPTTGSEQAEAARLLRILSLFSVETPTCPAETQSSWRPVLHTSKDRSINSGETKSSKGEQQEEGESRDKRWELP